MSCLAEEYKRAGKLDLAVPLFEEALRCRRASLGPEHPHTLSNMNNLAGAYREDGKLDLAVPLYEETRALHKARQGPDHPDTLTDTCAGN
jgi:hypothetical protein